MSLHLGVCPAHLCHLHLFGIDDHIVPGWRGRRIEDYVVRFLFLMDTSLFACDVAEHRGSGSHFRFAPLWMLGFSFWTDAHIVHLALLTRD